MNGQAEKSLPPDSVSAPATNSNVHIVNPEDLALEAKKGHRSRRALVILISILGLEILRSCL